MDYAPQVGQRVFVLCLVPSFFDTDFDTDFEFYAQLKLVMGAWYVRLMHMLYTCCLL